MSAQENAKEIQRWREEFVSWLRIGNVPGNEVGDALKTVESHCAETGESPQEAFGDPRAYAASLGLARRAKPSTYLIAVPAYFGTAFFLDGILELRRGGPVGYGWTDFASWILMLAVAIALVAAVGRVRRPALVAVVVLVAAFCGVGLLTFIRQDVPPIIEANAWVVTAAGVLLMGYAIFASRPSKASRVTDPVTGRDMLEDSPLTKWAPVIVPIVTMIAVVALSLAM